MKIEQIVDLFREEFPRPSSELTHTWAVFWANFKIFLSYKTWVITETLSTVASIAMYSFMGLQVDANRFFSVGYGDTTWLAFAIIGIATANYLWMCISRISHSLQHEVAEGTLEPIVSSMIKSEVIHNRPVHPRLPRELIFHVWSFADRSFRPECTYGNNG